MTVIYAMLHSLLLARCCFLFVQVYCVVRNFRNSTTPAGSACRGGNVMLACHVRVIPGRVNRYQPKQLPRDAVAVLLLLPPQPGFRRQQQQQQQLMMMVAAATARCESWLLWHRCLRQNVDAARATAGRQTAD
jgi:hypothetical protein